MATTAQDLDLTEGNGEEMVEAYRRLRRTGRAEGSRGAVLRRRAPRVLGVPQWRGAKLPTNGGGARAVEKKEIEGKMSRVASLAPRSPIY